MKSIYEASRNKILIAAHRGTCGANIPCNSLESFDLAIKEGADIIELDVALDFEKNLFVFHPGTEPAFLDSHHPIKKRTPAEMKDLHLVNCDLTPTQYKVPTLDEAFEHLKGRCYINTDKAFSCFPQLIECIRRHGIEEQIILKGSPSKPSDLDKVEEIASDIPFMSVIMEKDDSTEDIMRRNINFIGAEIVWADDAKSEFSTDEYIEKMHKMNKILWVNPIIFSYRRQLCGGHCDDHSLIVSEAEGWGWLADKGYDILQTDWVTQMKAYLEKSGKLAR